MDMFKVVKTKIRFTVGTKKAFFVLLRVHQKNVLRTLLFFFNIVIDHRGNIY